MEGPAARVGCGGQQRFRDGQAERLGGREVDDEIELGGCMSGKSAGFLALPEPGEHAVELRREIGRSNAGIARWHWAKDAR